MVLRFKFLNCCLINVSFIIIHSNLKKGTCRMIDNKGTTITCLDLGNKFSPNSSHCSIMHECCSNCLVPNLLNASVGCKKGLKRCQGLVEWLPLLSLPSLASQMESNFTNENINNNVGQLVGENYKWSILCQLYDNCQCLEFDFQLLKNLYKNVLHCGD